MTYRTYKTHFEAAHLIEGHPECGRKHGHSYKLYCKFFYKDLLKFVDFKDIDRDVQDVLKPYDHNDLGNATCEQIAISIAKNLKSRGYRGTIELNETEKYGVSLLIDDVLY